MTDRKRFVSLVITLAMALGAALILLGQSRAQQGQTQEQVIEKHLNGSLSQQNRMFDARILGNAARMIDEGRRVFRFDTFGDEAFWGDTLRLHQAIAGESLGGVGTGVSPGAALNIGLKVDVDALPESLINQLKAGKINLDDPAT